MTFHLNRKQQQQQQRSSPTTKMPSALPAADLAPLPKADGSASFAHLGYTVTAAVNGPIEAPRRDENAFEALVDVNVRPAAGVGGKIAPTRLQCDIS